MTCQEVRIFLSAYLDDELDVARSLETQAHLASCVVCSMRLESLRNIAQAIRSEALFFQPPPSLAPRIRAALGEPQARANSEPPPRTRPWSTSWMYAAAAIAILLMGTAMLLKTRNPPPETLVAQQVISSHIRSLMAEHLTDVRSMDRHTVKPWFAGKLDFSPDVKDLAAQGYPLIGGRLDYIDRRAVVALVYQRRHHIINVFVWPDTNASPQAAEPSIQGYNVIHWTSAGVARWAVSDLNPAELQQFVQLLGK